MAAVCVYCGSSRGARPAYATAARDLGTALAEGGHTVVYGGGSVGLMGLVADAAMASGGRVVGVIPTGLFSSEVPHASLSELVEVQTMHDRKMGMFERADAFVALPGGLGTLEELTELATWAQLGIHHKPIVTVDIDGYWQPFHQFLRQAVDEGFMKATNLAIIKNVVAVADVIPALFSA